MRSKNSGTQLEIEVSYPKNMGFLIENTSGIVLFRGMEIMEASIGEFFIGLVSVFFVQVGSDRFTTLHVH